MKSTPITAAQALLIRLGQLEVPFLFANSGTDFAPIIEAYESATREQLSSWPKPLTILHETVAVGMAHGAYLASGKPQAAMVHVNVGLANALMGLINAQSENIPLLMFAGRTPLTEYQRNGARMTPIQYGQEMRDQSAMLREVVKWDYELRYGEQLIDAVDRAYAVATAEPKGPVFLGLPREALAETIDGGRTPDHPTPPVNGAAGVCETAIAELATCLESATFPLVVCQRGDLSGELARALDTLCSEHAIGLIEPFVIRNLCNSEADYHLGYAVGKLVEKADCLILIDSPVPYIQRFTQPQAGCPVVHIGEDPLFSHLPMRSFPASHRLKGSPARIVEHLSRRLVSLDKTLASRQKNLQTERAVILRSQSEAVESASSMPVLTPVSVALALQSLVAQGAMVFSELGPPPQFAGLKYPNQWFTPPYSGGLGWGVPAAVGAKLACPEREVVACVGDGSYIFANPVACNQVMSGLGLPVITLVMNNSSWNATRRAVHNMYPSGQASLNENPVLTSLEPSPDFAAIASANGGWSARATTYAELVDALKYALEITKLEHRAATIEVIVAKTDGF